jgi:hypothetical protein
VSNSGLERWWWGRLSSSSALLAESQWKGIFNRMAASKNQYSEILGDKKRFFNSLLFATF